MSTTSSGTQTPVIYQADPAVVQHLNGVRDSLHQSCKPYLNHQVQVQTLDGQMHEGTLAGMDSKNMYLVVTIATDMGADITILITSPIQVRDIRARATRIPVR